MINGTIIHYINGLYKLIIHDYPFINGILPTQLPVEKRGPVAPVASVFCFFAAGSTVSAMVKNDEGSAAPVSEGQPLNALRFKQRRGVHNGLVPHSFLRN